MQLFFYNTVIKLVNLHDEIKITRINVQRLYYVFNINRNAVNCRNITRLGVRILL